MSNSPDKTIGVPPADSIRFTCKRNQPKLNQQDIEQLISAVNQEKNRSSKYSQQILDGVLGFLDTGQLHDFEGRDYLQAKKSFAESELEMALSFPDDETRIKYLVYRYKFIEYPKNKIVDGFPIVVSLEPVSYCNLRCTMCFQVDRKFFTDKSVMGFMDMTLYRKLVDEMAENQLCSLLFGGRGEPMLHKNFIEMVTYATQKGIIDTKINTNATKLTAEKSRELLRAAPKTIVFSVDAGNKQEYEAIRVGANFDQVVANIKTFHEIREKEFPQSRSRTRVSMTIFRESQDAKEAENLWSNMVDEFSIQSADFRVDIYDHPLLLNETRPCALLWERLYVWWDGNMNPCDIDYRSHLGLGQISKERPTIKSIWLGEKMEKMRRDHLEGRKNSFYPCNQCYGL